MSTSVEVAVIPAAGLGTRNFVSPAIPKEMLPIFDRPIIGEVVAEARAAGIKEFVFVISRKKEMIGEHFAPHPDLEETLHARGKTELLDVLANIKLDPSQVKFVYQDQPLGLGHAVLCAKEHVGNRPFAVLLPDEVMLGKPSCLEQMLTEYQERGGNMIASQTVPRDQTGSYGILQTRDENGVKRIEGMVEKPKPSEAPSTSAIIGRYVLRPEIFGKLEKTDKGAGGEIQLTDGMAALLRDQAFYEFSFKGARHDCGNFPGLFKCAATLALQSQKHGDEIFEILRAQVNADPRNKKSEHTTNLAL